MAGTGTGIIVFGFIRTSCLSNTLKSLAMQNAHNVHVWLDVPADSNPDHNSKSMECIQCVKSNFAQFEPNVMSSHTGIEVMTLEGLKFMCERYKKIIVLEDDCFPVCDAIDVFNDDLDRVEDDENIFSVYGHHYLVRAENGGRPIGRFNGWGWATHSSKLENILPELERLLFLPDEEYFNFVKANLDWRIKRRIDVTPKRNAVRSIKKVKSWDGIMCLITAMQKLTHKRTSKRVIYNCGSNPDSSMHYKNTLRKPPFNMIDEDEVWDYFNRANLC